MDYVVSIAKKSKRPDALASTLEAQVGAHYSGCLQLICVYIAREAFSAIVKVECCVYRAHETP